MSNLVINFSGRDFTAEYERLLALLRQELPAYTDLNYSDPGMVMLALVARETDQLNYYIDRVAQEGFLRTAVFKQSLIELGRMVDYLPVLASPAYTTLRLTRVAGVTGSITIPKYTSFERNDGLPYTTVEESTMPEEDGYVDVYAIQGEVITEEILTSAFTSTEWSNQRRYSLPANTIEALFEMYHTENVDVYWSEADTFWRSSSDDRVFLLELNGDDTVSLVVGDGTFGADFTGISKIYIRYLTTSGPDGNCGTGRVVTVPDEYEDIITCSNIELATGGAVSESIDSIRTSIPAVTRTQRRGVTLTDYEVLISHIPGVLACQAVDRNSSTEWPHFHIPIYALPDGGGTIPEYLYNTILGECCEWGHLGPWPERYILRNVTAVPVNITAVVGLSLNQNQASVDAAIKANLASAFSPTEESIDGTVSFSSIFNAFVDTPGVSSVAITSPTSTVSAGVGEILTLGTVTLSYGQ